MKPSTIAKPRKTTASTSTAMRADTAKHVFGLLKWPLFGALLAGGALVVARAFGPRVVRDLGDAGGEGFAEGVARVQRQFAALQKNLPSISGERGTYPRAHGDVIADYLRQFPGFAGAGVTLENLGTQWSTVYEVRWLRGYPVPMLPPSVDGHPVNLEIVDALPVPQPGGPGERGRYT